MPRFENALAKVFTHGWELGGVVTAETGAPAPVTIGGGRRMPGRCLRNDSHACRGVPPDADRRARRLRVIAAHVMPAEG